MAKIGPLLERALGRMHSGESNAHGSERSVVAAHVDAAVERGELSVLLKLKREKPRRDDSWKSYKARVDSNLKKHRKKLPGKRTKNLYLANSLVTTVDVQDVAKIAESRDIEYLELDSVIDPTCMDDSIVDIALEDFRTNNGTLTGEGIRLAVLDSGIDVEHPFLDVERSVSTSGEVIEIPGRHGTHCAGSVASRDSVFPGVAPDVKLLNVKVLKSDGSGSFSQIVQGVDKALDFNADILSMSVGFNHLPSWSDRGHGWSCPDGRCPLCTAVDNASRLGAIVCVAAGNEHTRAETLRRFGNGNTFDTELGCPGQSRRAITVGAMTKRTFLPADFSSRGPSSYGLSKPDLAAPGVNVMSTIPVPRRVDGQLEANPRRVDLFGRSSGTSMATPMVAGATALILQDRRIRGLSDSPAAVQKALIEEAVKAIELPVNVVGAGRLWLGGYGAILQV